MAAKSTWLPAMAYPATLKTHDKTTRTANGVSQADRPPKFEISLVVAILVPNVEMSRANEGATPAPQEACLRKASAPMNG